MVLGRRVRGKPSQFAHTAGYSTPTVLEGGGERVAPLPLEPPYGAQLAAVVVLILSSVALVVAGPSGSMGFWVGLTVGLTSARQHRWWRFGTPVRDNNLTALRRNRTQSIRSQLT